MAAMHRMHERVLVCALASGCGPLVAYDDTGAVDSSGTDATSVGPDPTLTTSVGPTTVTTTPTTTIDPTGDPVCPTFDLGSSVPNSVSSVIDDETDQFSGSCGGAAVDAVLSFVAPADGDYTFATAGTNYDTVLYVLDGVCGGAELACNDDTADTSSAVSLHLFEGQAISVVIDGFSPGVSGAWHIDVDVAQSSCPDGELGSELPVSAADSTQGAADVLSPACVLDDGPERSWLWTAPHAGVFTFDSDGGELFSAVYLRDGVCDGSELACDAGTFEPTSGISGVVTSLAAGQVVTVVVDGLFGASGFVQLNIDELAGVCPAGDLGSIVPQELSDDTFAFGNSGGRSCGGWFAPDATYVWSAPTAGTYRFAVPSASFPWVLAVHDAVCGGGELGCVDLFSDGEGAPIVLDMIAGQLVVVAVDGLGHQGGAFDLVIEPDVCPELDLGAAVPVGTSGNLVGATPSVQAQCAPTQGGDVGYRFTAPQDGTYRIDTIGSAFDTVLSVRDGGCGGAELACDDDAGGNLSSLVELDLGAGQTIVITVEGFDGDAGDYALTVQAI